MKILFVITDLEVGGAELMLYKILTKLDSAQFTCEVVNLGEGGVVQSKIEELSIPVHNLNLKSIFSFSSGVSKLKKIIDQTSPDLIQGWMYHANVLASHAAKNVSKKVPVLWGIRYSLADTSTNKLTTRLLIRYSGFLSKKASRIVFNSQMGLTHHEKIGYPKETSSVIPNGLNMEEWGNTSDAKNKLCSELNLENANILIGMIGRFDSAKDYPTFLKAASMVSLKNPQIHFVLVGPGMDRSNTTLRSWIVQNRVELKVHLLGERNDIPYIMQGLDISTVASRTESFPNVLLEAMASGTPSVVSEVGDSPVVIGDTGLTFPVRNPQKLAEAWENLLSKGSQHLQELGKKARERAQKNYSLEVITNQYQKLFKEVVQN